MDMVVQPGIWSTVRCSDPADFVSKNDERVLRMFACDVVFEPDCV